MRSRRTFFASWSLAAVMSLIGCGDDLALHGLPYGAGGNADIDSHGMTTTRPGCAGGLGSGATGSGATGSGATGSGATGSGATGSGATGTGATGSGATGSGATGSGATGAGAGSSGVDPCAAGGGGQSGASGNAGTAGASGFGGTGGAPDCPPDEKVCPSDTVQHTFTYPDAGETSVSVKGSWDAWTTAVSLTKSGSTWSGDVAIPLNTQVEYKFILNGTTYVADPNNPVTTGPDMNSVLAPIDCDPATKICGTSPILGYDWRDAVMYFVFVDRFQDGDPTNNAPESGVETPANYQGGDYQGVIDKIEAGYFTGLGVNTLWITVPLDNTEDTGLGISEAGVSRQYSAYHGYWVSKNDQVEEHFGTMAKLKELVSVAHTNGLKILIDYPMNHVHISSPVYAQHPEWFWPLSYNGGQCTCGGSAVCSYDDPNTTTRCWFTTYLPDFNYSLQAARDYTTDNAVWWLQQIGADGYRLDAIKHVDKAWVSDMRAKAKAQLESVTQQTVYMVGETFDEGNPGKLREYVGSSLLHGQFDFPMRRQIEDKILRRAGSMADLDAFLNVNDGFYGPNAIMSTFMGNHDISRIIHKAEDNPWEPNDWTDLPGIPTSANPFQRVGVGFTLLFTTKGIPLVYYGDEVGMPGGRDPDNRRFMQWTNYTNNQNTLKTHVAKLGAIRAAHPALRKGTRTTLTVTQDTYLYKMESADDLVVVALNRSDNSQSIAGLPSGAWKDLLTDAAVAGSIQLGARSSMVLVKQLGCHHDCFAQSSFDLAVASPLASSLVRSP